MSGIQLPNGFLDELKSRIRPSDVIGRKVKLKKQGKEWVGLSPFTNEKTPSFYVNDQKQIFKCFSSGIGGDVISFLQETERLSFMEAVEKLAEEAGMSLPKPTPQAQAAYDRNQRLFDVCEAATKFFENQLREAAGREARDYLQGRGLVASSWGRYRLGFAPDDWRTTYEHLVGQGFSKAEILAAGLAVQKEGGGDPYDRFRGRVMFPIENSQGRVIAFGGRGMAPDAKPKYLNSSDTPLFHKGKVLYHYKAAREALGYGEGGGLIVCEGYMDVIALAEAGFGHAVAPLGTALTEDQLGLLWRAGPEPLLCFDGDAAGLRAAYRSIDRALPFLEPGRSLFFCLLEDGMDPDDFIKAKGRAAMAEKLSDGFPLAQLLWQRERDREKVDTPERKAGLEERLKQAAAQIRHGAVKSAYERDLRGRMNDYFWDLRQAERSAGKPSWSGKSGRPEGVKPPAQTIKIRGLGFLANIIDNPELLERCAEDIVLANWQDPDVAHICEAILDLFDSDMPLDRGLIRDHLTGLGKTRAAELLIEYPPATPLDPDGAEAREWLIALEQFVESSEHEDGETANVFDDATASADAWRLRHKKVAERRAMRARMNEAAEKADQS